MIVEFEFVLNENWMIRTNSTLQNLEELKWNLKFPLPLMWI